MARKIAVAIHKGGVGKTTTAKNVAAALAMRGKRTLLVDLDEQANATKGLGIDPAALEATINDLFADPDRDPGSVLLMTLVEGLHLMPAHPDLAKTETVLPSGEGRHSFEAHTAEARQHLNTAKVEKPTNGQKRATTQRSRKLAS